MNSKLLCTKHKVAVYLFPHHPKGLTDNTVNRAVNGTVNSNSSSLRILTVVRQYSSKNWVAHNW